MAEPNAATEAPSEASLLARIEAQIEPPEPEQVEAPEPAQTEATDEPTVDDLEQEAPAPITGDEFVLKYQGQELKKTRQEALELAEKGLDYTQKTQSLAAERQALQQRAELIDQMHAMMPQVADARAQLGQLHAYIQHLDQQMAQQTEADPVAAFQTKIRRDQAVEQWQQAKQYHDGLYGQFQQAQQVIRQKVLQAEMPKLLERIPAWKDPQKLESERGLIRSSLIAEGFSEQEIGGLMDSRMVAVARKAALYDQLVKNKGAKKLDGLPPVNRPGSPMTNQQKAQASRMEYKKAIKGAKTEGQAAKVIEKRLESFFK